MKTNDDFTMNSIINGVFKEQKIKVKWVENVERVIDKSDSSSHVYDSLKNANEIKDELEETILNFKG